MADTPRKLTLKKPGEDASNSPPPAPAEPPQAAPPPRKLTLSPAPAPTTPPPPPPAGGPAAPTDAPRKLTLSRAPGAAPLDPAPPAADPPPPPAPAPRKLTLNKSADTPAAPPPMPGLPAEPPKPGGAPPPQLAPMASPTDGPAPPPAPSEEGPSEASDSKELLALDGLPPPELPFPKKKKGGMSKQKIIMLAAGAVIAVVFGVIGVMFVGTFLGSPVDTAGPVTEAPVAPPETAADPVDAAPAAEPAAEPETNQWALTVTAGTPVVIDDSTIFAAIDGAFTVEAWFKVDTVATLRSMVLRGDDQEKSFRLGLRGGKSGRPVAEFGVPSASAEVLSVRAPRKSRWIHLAGVYSGDELRLFCNGSLVAQHAVSTIDMASFTSLSVHLDATDAESTAAIDELRISKTARYSTHFRPARTHVVDDDTAALIPFEKRDSGQLMDRARDGKAMAVSGANWVDVAVLVEHENTRRLPFPYHLMLEFEDNFPPEAVKQIAAEWAKLDDAQRRDYIRELESQ